MDFKLKCTFVKNLWVNQEKTSYLIQVCEQIPGKDYTKKWAIWCKTALLPHCEYLVEGYISESPDKNYVNQAGKQAYKANFNATNVIPLDANHSFPDVPEIDDSEEIPF